MVHILNGGLEGALLSAIGDENLTPNDIERRKYLESLPKGVWIALDENGKAMTEEEAQEKERQHLARFKKMP
jgi:hypothetical protein